MKVFFVGSPRFGWNNQKVIYQYLKKLNIQHTSRFTEEVNPRTFYNVTEDVWQKRYVSRMTELKQADFCVFEASVPSHSIGQLVQEALREEKPVIALHTKDYQPVFMEGSEGVEKRLQVLEYDLDNLGEVLDEAIEYVKELLTTRFTMLMPAKMVRYLERVNVTKGISKSAFIRDLVSREMEKE